MELDQECELFTGYGQKQAVHEADHYQNLLSLNPRGWRPSKNKDACHECLTKLQQILDQVPSAQRKRTDKAS